MNKRTKKCCRCGKELPLSHFGIAPTYADGRRGVCKDCIKEYNERRKQTLREQQKYRYF